MTVQPTASGIDRSRVDASVRLQDDMFGHVNGAWLRDYEMPADRSSDGEFRRLRDLSEERVREIVEEAAGTDAPLGTPDGRIGALYRAFMDIERIEAAGLDPLRPQLEEILAAGNASVLTRLMGRADAATSIVHPYVWTDDRDSTRYQVRLHQGGLGLPDESYYREPGYAEVRTAYVAHLARLA